MKSASSEPTMRRWRAFLIGSGIALLGAALLSLLAAVHLFGIVLGVVIGMGLGGAWAPLATSRQESEPEPQPAAAGRASGRAPQPFTALARMLAPLALPLVVVIAAGTVDSELWVQILVGAIAGLFAWVVSLRVEIPGLREILPVLGNGGLAFWIAVGVIGVPTLIVAVSYADGGIERFEDRGGWSTAFFLLAVIVWAVAALIRLASFATSWLRLAQAVVIGLLLLRLVIAAGLLPGHATLARDFPAMDAGVLAAAVALLLLAEIAIGMLAVVRGRTADAARWTTEHGALSLEWTRWLRALGVGAALVSALALGAAVVVGLEEATDDSEGRLTLAGARIEPEIPETTPAEMLPEDRDADERKLVATYQPVLAFREDQQWLPEAVDEFVTESELIGPDDTEPAGSRTVETLPDSCPGVMPSPCYRLTIDCPTADGCAEDDQPDRGAPTMRDPVRSGAVYARVVRDNERHKAFPPSVGTFGGERPSILIQYWYFYPYDEWSTPVLAGQLVQRHEADWEVVMVGLSDSRPLFVAYSQHCTGQWLEWEDIEVADLPPPRTRPLVAVARGSQAHYPRADQRRSPDWGKCAGVPEGTVAVASYASNIRDLTGYGFAWKAAEVKFVDGQTPPMTFPGIWGAHGGAELVNARSFTLEKGGEPKTPSMQPQWTDPLTTALCRWRPPRDQRRRC